MQDEPRPEPGPRPSPEPSPRPEPNPRPGPRPRPDIKSLASLTSQLKENQTDVKLSTMANITEKAECIIFWDDWFTSPEDSEKQPFALYTGYFYLGDTWNDQTSSIIINHGIWRFYENANYNENGNHPGYEVTLGPGRYEWVETYGIRNDSLSSVKLISYTP